MDKRIAELERRNVELTLTFEHCKAVIDGLFSIARSKTTGAEITYFDISEFIETIDFRIDRTNHVKYFGEAILSPASDTRYAPVPHYKNGKRDGREVYNGNSHNWVNPNHHLMIEHVFGDTKSHILWAGSKDKYYGGGIGDPIISNTHHSEYKPRQENYIDKVLDYAKLRKLLLDMLNIEKNKESEHIDVIYRKNLEIQTLKQQDAENSRIRGLAVKQHLIFQDQIRSLNAELAELRISNAELGKKIKDNTKDHKEQVRALKVKHEANLREKDLYYKDLYNKLVIRPEPVDYAESLETLSERNSYLERDNTKLRNDMQEEIRSQIEQLRTDYNSQIKDLENRLKQETELRIQRDQEIVDLSERNTAIANQLSIIRGAITE